MIDRVTTLPVDHFPNVSWKYVRTGGRYTEEEARVWLEIRFEWAIWGCLGWLGLSRDREYSIV